VSVDVIDPVVFLRDWYLELALGTPLEGVAIWTLKREPETLPPYLILAEAGDVRHPAGPAFAPARVELSAWHYTDREVATLFRTAIALVHRRHVVLGGIGCFMARSETGLQRPFEDPDTGWWRGFGVIDLVLLDQLIT
jgi:hypothetical protein